MEQTKLPSLGLLVAILGFALFSEMVYTISLPRVAEGIGVSMGKIQYTLAIYFIGVAIGTLVWGFLSDRYGRKSSLMKGLWTYVIGCTCAYLAPSFTVLLVGRALQGLGASAASVMGQAICQDIFHGTVLAQVYSTIAGFCAFALLVGPLIGNFIASHYTYSTLFLFLGMVGLALAFLVSASLPETLKRVRHVQIGIGETAKIILSDVYFLACVALNALGAGIVSLYYGEGPYYFIDLLGLPSNYYSYTFIGIAAANMIGGYASRMLHQQQVSYVKIVLYGLAFVAAGSGFLTAVSLFTQDFVLEKATLISLAFASMMMIALGSCIITTNVLNMALERYKVSAGAASSLLNFLSNIGISLLSCGMASIHSSSLLPMPLYFCFISLVSWIIFKIFIVNSSQPEMVGVKRSSHSLRR